MSDQRGNMLAGPFIMLLSAAVFGYFGFTTSFVHTSAITGKLLIYVPLLEWTLKITAIAFAASAAVSFIRPVVGNVLFGIAGLLSALAFVVVAIMDFADTQHMVMSPVLLLIFAAWNGYGSWTGLSSVMLMQRTANRQDRPFGES